MHELPPKPWPSRISALPVDERGYPIPYFVARVDGVPDFRIADAKKFMRCLTDNRCWICGDRLGVYKAFILGPAGLLNRTTAEPPSHCDCAKFALQACPFLVEPKRRRNDNGKPDGVTNPGGEMLTHNPGVSLLWVTKKFDVHRVENGYIIEVGKPEEVGWYREGRIATRAEVEAAMEISIPLLEEEVRRGGHEDRVGEVMEQYLKMQPLLPRDDVRLEEGNG